MKNDLDHAALKAKQRAIREEEFPEPMGLRVHRAISWVGRAEACGEDDDDARFIFLWIAFNAVYGGEREFHGVAPKERTAFAGYFKQLVELDEEKRIYNALWKRFSGPVRTLMDNEYVFSPFWKYKNGMKEFENWEKQFKSTARIFAKSFQSGDSVRVLSFVFDRLYVLRNQIIHGGATWKSKVNREQVRDGAEILGFLMPVFIDIMMDNPKEDWGKPFYPVVE